MPGRRSAPVQAALRPFKDQISGVVVESTYNWYWLVDGLQEAVWPKVSLRPEAG